jgi:tellurium resistance protein TerD
MIKMAINLRKGESAKIPLKHLVVGLGWDPATKAGVDFDLDAMAFALGFNKKTPKEDFFVFFNNKVSPDGAVLAGGDDRSGRNSDGGDDETITIDLSKIDFRINSIVIAASIYDGITRRQNFGQVSNAYIRIVNADNNQELMRYQLDDDFSNEVSVEFGRIAKKGLDWEFEALGTGSNKEIDYLVEKYVG